MKAIVIGLKDTPNIRAFKMLVTKENGYVIQLRKSGLDTPLTDSFCPTCFNGSIFIFGVGCFCPCCSTFHFYS